MTRTVEAAVIESPDAGEFSVQPVELDAPGTGEVRVSLEYAGACHTDWHAVEGTHHDRYPVVGGHEGAGTVAEVGPGVDGVEEGDRVLTLWVPACGTCEACVAGNQHLCLEYADVIDGTRPDGTCRVHRDGEDVAQFLSLGTFAEELVVPESALVRVPDEVALDVASIVGCGVVTGYGSAVHRGEVAAGDTVVVVGAGNVGLNAVQGASLAGASAVVAVDPVELKRETAAEFGATDVVDPDAAAVEEAVAAVDPTGADVVVLAVGSASGELVGESFQLLGQRGRLVVTAGSTDDSMAVPPQSMIRGEAEIVGCLYGGASPRRTTREVLERYVAGEYRLDELVTAHYALEDVNEAYENLLGGRDVHGVIEL